MPKLYEYFGLIVFFYSNEHEPIHVHGRYQGSESKAEIIIANGVIENLRITEVKGKLPLKGKELKRFEKLVNYYKEAIVKKWIDFFVYNLPVEAEKITQELE